MSDVMLFGVLRMPYDMAMSNEISRIQYWQCGQQAADEIESLRAELAAERQKREEAERERDELRAARMAYASEFKLNDDGEPDTGNIHANIRSNKAALEKARETFAEISGYFSKASKIYCLCEYGAATIDKVLNP